MCIRDSTYRAAHPFYTLVIPERVDGFVNSLIEQGAVSYTHLDVYKRQRGHKDFQSFALPTELWHLVVIRSGNISFEVAKVVKLLDSARCV